MKPKAPRWLTEAFRDGVDEFVYNRQVSTGPHERLIRARGQHPSCWLAPHDPKQRPCSGPMERFHFISRQRVENVLWDLLWDSQIVVVCSKCKGAGLLGGGIVSGDLCPRCAGRGRWEAAVTTKLMWELILLAAWDPRNGGLGCEHHHRRFDGHACSPRAPKIVVPWDLLPDQVDEFVVDYGLDGPAAERFPMLP